jgi:hypothetical protein
MKHFYKIVLLFLMPFYALAQNTRPDYVKGRDTTRGSKTEFEKYSEGKSFGLFAGVGLNRITTQPTGSYQKAGGTAYTSSFPQVSFGSDFFVNPNTRRLVFRGELIVGLGHYNSAYTNKYSPYIPINYKYDQLAFGITPQIIYNFYNTENFKIYLGIGAEFALYKYSNAVFTSQDGKTPPEQITTYDPYFFSNNNTIFIFKAGILFTKHIGVYANYLTSAPVTRDPYFDLNFTTMQVGVNYYF